MKKLKKIRLEDIKLSEEIIKHKTDEKEIKKVWEDGKFWKINIFESVIPYREFKIILLHPIIPKRSENVYYDHSKYGWWMYCARKDELDETDKKLVDMIKESSKYGMYREGTHSFCFDNMWKGSNIEGTPLEGIDSYNLHPNEMVEIIKKNIDRFYDDKEKKESVQ